MKTYLAIGFLLCSCGAIEDKFGKSTTAQKAAPGPEATYTDDFVLGFQETCSSGVYQAAIDAEKQRPKDAAVTMYCSCIFDATSHKWTMEYVQQNDFAVSQVLKADGTYTRCAGVFAEYNK